MNIRATVLWLAVVTAILFASTTHGFSVSEAHQDSFDFDSFVDEYHKLYSAQEYAFRKKIYEHNVEKIQHHNADSNNIYFKRVNHMTDWTDEEFQSLNQAKPRMRVATPSFCSKAECREPQMPAPYQVDYRQSYPPVLTNIKNQGRCGSCWAHSAVEAIESHWAIATGDLHVLSAQQLTSCTENPRHCGGTGGCFGAIESLAYEYAMKAGGIAEEWAYPYTSYYGDSGTCQNISSTYVVAKVADYVRLPTNDQTSVMKALAFRGPLAVSVDASGWRAYGGGIFDGCRFSQNITQNHAVQLVGYGRDSVSQKDYWIVRNSWGPRWGENGYIRILRQNTPDCGWSVNAHDGSACDGDPDIVWVCGMCGILSDTTYPLMDTSSLK